MRERERERERERPAPVFSYLFPGPRVSSPVLKWALKISIQSGPKERTDKKKSGQYKSMYKNMYKNIWNFFGHKNKIKIHIFLVSRRLKWGGVDSKKRARLIFNTVMCALLVLYVEQDVNFLHDHHVQALKIEL